MKNWSDDVWDPYLTIQEEEESEGGLEGERRAFDAKPLLEGWGQLGLGQVGIRNVDRAYVAYANACHVR